MPAVKLETFEVATGSGGLQTLRSKVLERERNEAYANGFKDGVNVTRDAVKAEQNRLLAAIFETVSDGQITRQEASAAAVRSLRPVLDALIGHLAPQLARLRFAHQVLEVVAAARRKDADAAIRLYVAPEQVEATRERLSGEPCSVAVAADPELGALEARMDWSDGSDVIDFDSFLQGLDEVLADFHNLTEESQDERNRNAG